MPFVHSWRKTDYGLQHDILKHPNVVRTADGKAKPYKHGEVTKDIASIFIWDIDPKLPDVKLEETTWELLSDEELKHSSVNKIKLNLR